MGNSNLKSMMVPTKNLSKNNKNFKQKYNHFKKLYDKIYRI